MIQTEFNSAVKRLWKDNSKQSLFIQSIYLMEKLFQERNEQNPIN